MYYLDSSSSRQNHYCNYLSLSKSPPFPTSPEATTASKGHAASLGVPVGGASSFALLTRPFSTQDCRLMLPLVINFRNAGWQFGRLKNCLIFFKLFCLLWIILNIQKRVEIKGRVIYSPPPPNTLVLSYQCCTIYATQFPILKNIDLVETSLNSSLITSLRLHPIGNNCNKSNV